MQHITRGALQLAMQITGNRDDAMDVLQNAVIKSLEHRHAPKPDDAGYRAWFYRVVHNQAIDWLRSQRKFDRDANIDQLPGQSDPHKTLALEERKFLLHKALNGLGAEQREIICLKDFHDFSYQEIAQIMGLEKGTVMSRLHRARLALKDKLAALDFGTGDNDGV